jgi:hypothetical protein
MKAFPKIREYQDEFGQGGMDLRDYFASKAMQGLLATISYEHSTGDISDMEIANRAYLIADAMMKARTE